MGGRAQSCRLHRRREQRTMCDLLVCPIFKCMLCFVHGNIRSAYDWASLGARMCMAMSFASGDSRNITLVSLGQVAAPYALLFVAGSLASPASASRLKTHAEE